MTPFLIIAACVAIASGGTVEPGVQDKIQSGKLTKATIELPQVVDKLKDHAALKGLTGDKLGAAVAKVLIDLTSKVQAAIMAALKLLGVQATGLWASNIIVVEGDLKKLFGPLGTLAVDGDYILREQLKVKLDAPIDLDASARAAASKTQWGVDQIQAPAAWLDSKKGAGCVVMIVDTGVNMNHEALKDGFTKSWKDPYHKTPNPTDKNGHGSHCAGTAVGRKNGVGVAPGAKWSACRGLDHDGSGTEKQLTECFQFTVQAKPKPHVSSNSWGGPGGNRKFDPLVQTLRAANIIPVFANGNTGSGCHSVGSPADGDDLIAVGATTKDDRMADFSSRGPTKKGGLKPDVSAPGKEIVSCGTRKNDYVTLSGTSMATPNVAGAICLLLVAHPKWGFKEVYKALTTTTVKPQVEEKDKKCGLPVKGKDYPNYAWGHGRIDVAAALKAKV